MNRFRRLLHVIAFVALGSLAVPDRRPCGDADAMVQGLAAALRDARGGALSEWPASGLGLDGNLFTGVQLQNIRVVQNGETLISAEGFTSTTAFST